MSLDMSRDAKLLKSRRQYLIAKDMFFHDCCRVNEETGFVSESLVLSNVDFTSLASLIIVANERYERDLKFKESLFKCWSDIGLRHIKYKRMLTYVFTFKDVVRCQYISKSNAKRSMRRLGEFGFFAKSRMFKGVHEHLLRDVALDLVFDSAILAIDWDDLVRDSINAQRSEADFASEFDALVRKEDKALALSALEQAEEEEVAVFESSQCVAVETFRDDKDLRIRRAIGFDTRGVPIRIVLMAFVIIDDLRNGLGLNHHDGKILKGDRTNVTFRINLSWRLLCKKIGSDIFPMRILPRQVLNKKFTQWKV